MKFEVRRQRIKGVPLERDTRTSATPVVGDLRIEDQRSQRFGRTVRVATLMSLDRQVDPGELPQLFDVQVLWMSPQSMVLGGFEVIENTGYTQTWLCTPVPDRQQPSPGTSRRLHDFASTLEASGARVRS